MFFKHFKNMLVIFLLSFYIIPFQVRAYSDYIIAGGENIGIQMKTSGILVVGLYRVNDRFPGQDAGIKIGDKIISINNYKVSSIDDMINKINVSNSNAKIKYIRDGVEYTTTLILTKSENGYKTGLYVKDAVSGVGTLTYIDPKTKIFGALGHEIFEKTTGKIFETNDGKIFKSVITNIEKSRNGSPGEKNATLYSNIIYGNIEENTNQGIFGDYKVALPNREWIEVGKPGGIKLGIAHIMTVIKEETIESFDIEILKVNHDTKTKNILFRIIDKRLLETTGGVVQGMSGSPIIQNHKIIGAVTHVVVEDASKGYGIFITNMLEEGDN